MRLTAIFTILAASAVAACGQPKSEGNSSTAQSAPEPPPAITQQEYFLKLAARPVALNKVEFEVATNAPLPIQTMADVTLAGLKDEETWIGESQKVTLDKATTTFVLDTSQAGKRLPAGKYVAEISYYQLWGANNNPAARDVPDMSAKQDIQIGGSGESATHARSKAAMQRWVMVEMDVDRPWTDAELKSKLGPFERGRTRDGAFTYYFPEADLTMFVAPSRNKVFTSKLGRVR